MELAFTVYRGSLNVELEIASSSLLHDHLNITIICFPGYTVLQVVLNHGAASPIA